MTLVVRLEGTLTTGADPDLGVFGVPKPGAKEKLRKAMDKGFTVVVVSAACKYPTATKMLWRWLVAEGFDFTDVWCGEGIPSGTFVDDDAVKLSDL